MDAKLYAPKRLICRKDPTDLTASLTYWRVRKTKLCIPRTAMIPYVVRFIMLAVLFCSGRSVWAGDLGTGTTDRRPTPLYSQTFLARGVANGSDVTPPFFDHNGKLASSRNVGAEPWEDVSINIVGVEVAYLQVPIGLQYTFVGNSYAHDLMLTMGKGTTEGRQMFPSGTAFEFPGRAYNKGARGKARPAHIDLHVAATKGADFQAYVVIYYTRNPR